MEQLDAGWSPLPTERPAGGDRDDADPELEAAEADREAIEAMVAADREVIFFHQCCWLMYDGIVILVRPQNTLSKMNYKTSIYIAAYTQPTHLN